MTELFTALFQAVTQGLMLVNSAKATEYQNKFTQNQLAISEEERKGDAADDGKIEGLYAAQKILAQAAENEFKLAMASRNATPAASS